MSLAGPGAVATGGGGGAFSLACAAAAAGSLQAPQEEGEDLQGSQWQPRSSPPKWALILELL